MFTIYSDSGSDATMVSNLFIDEYMKNANDAQIKVYLYLLRVMGAHRTTSVPELADLFNHTEKDVVRSLRFWEKKGLLDLTFDEKQELVSIRLRRPGSSGIAAAQNGRHILSFSAPGAERESLLRMASGGGTPVLPGPQDAQDSCPPQSLSARQIVTRSVQSFSAPQVVLSAAQEPSSPQAVLSAAQTQNALSTAQAVSADRSSASPAGSGSAASAPAEPPQPAAEGLSEIEALERFRNDPERASLLFVIEQYIGKPLSLNEIRIIYNISEQLRFSDELMDYLIQYCVDRGKKDFRYIKKVAENWASLGVMTPAQAESAASPDSAPRRKTGNRARGASSGRSGGAEDPSGGSTAGAPGAENSGKPSRRARTANSFNQFEQNSYDFDALEEELLQS